MKQQQNQFYVIQFCLRTIDLRVCPYENYLVTISSKVPPSGIDLVDAVYLINLDRRRDRLAYMNAILDEHRIGAIKVSACDGNLVTKEMIQELTGRYYADNYLKKVPNRSVHASIGCLLSHLSVLQNALERGFQVIWVLEDDIKVVGDIAKIPGLLSKLSLLDPDWDILYTDVPTTALCVCPPHRGLLFSGRNQLQAEEYNDDFKMIHWRNGTYSMLISAKGIKKILDYFLSSDVYGPIDNDIHCISGIRQYSVQKDVVTHASQFTSDIEYSGQ